MATKAKQPMYIQVAPHVKTSVLLGNHLIVPGEKPRPTSGLNKQHLATALSAGLVVDTEKLEKEQLAAAKKEAQKTQKPRQPRTPKKAKPFSHNPEDLKDLSFEDLLIKCADEYDASLPEGEDPDEANYPNPEDRESAVKYLSQNFKK